MNLGFHKNNSKKKLIGIDKILDGDVSKIRKSLLYIVKFLGKDVTTLAPVAARAADHDFFSRGMSQP